jgi:hypothetical protein
MLFDVHNFLLHLFPGLEVLNESQVNEIKGES